MISQPGQDQERILGLSSATAIVVAAMIGSGIFFTTGEIGPSLVTPTNVLLVWVTCGLLALCGALTLGELGAMIPHAGGAYVFVKRAFGRTVGCFVGLEYALVGTPASLAIISLVMGKYLVALLPWIPMRVSAIAAIVIITLIHCRGTSFGAIINNIGAVLKLLLLASFILLGLVLPAPGIITPGPEMEAPGILSSQFAEAVIIVNFAFLGWAIVATLGGEIKRPSRNIPLGVLGGVTLVTVIYLLMNVVFLRALSPTEMVDADGTPTSTLGYMVAEVLFPSWVANSLGGLIVLLMISTILSVVLSGGRMAFAMARNGQMHQGLARVNSRGAPVPALVLQGLITIGFILAFDILQLLLFTGLLGLFAFVLMIGSVIFLRWQQPGLNRPFRVPLYPLPPLVSIGVSIWLAWHIAVTRSGAVVVSAITIGVLGLLTVVIEKRGGSGPPPGKNADSSGDEPDPGGRTADSPQGS